MGTTKLILEPHSLSLDDGELVLLDYNYILVSEAKYAALQDNKLISW